MPSATAPSMTAYRTACNDWRTSSSESAEGEASGISRMLVRLPSAISASPASRSTQYGSEKA